MTFRDDIPFRVSDALAAGRRRRDVDSRRYEMPFHGVRAPLGADVDVEDRCRAYQLRMRQDAAFSSLTAADLWGVPLPAVTDRSRLHVSVPHGMPRPRSRGVHGAERSSNVAIVVRSGLRVLDPAETWASLGPVFELADLVAAGDFLVGSVRADPLASVAGLEEVAQRRALGGPTLRAALPFIRTRSLSRPESLLRLLLITSGLPEPELNYRVPDLDVMIDLAWPAARFGIEYQGDHHRDPSQFGADIRRQERVHDAEWLLMGVTRFDLFDSPLELVDRARARLEVRGIRSRRTNPPKWARPHR
jgi:hypothetical protein